MKRFQFTLQALWTLRQRQEHDALETYGHTLRQRQAAQAALDKAGQDLARASQELRRQLEEGCDGSSATRSRSACSAIQERQTHCQADLAAAEQQVRKAFDVMIDARHQREIVDKLKERQHQRYERELAVIETKLLDEMAQRRSPLALEGRPSL